MTDLRSSEVHLYLLRVEPGQSILQGRYDAFLDDQERARTAAFVFDEDRRIHVAARLLLRSLLGKYTRVHPSRLRFAKNRYGKPELARMDNREDFQFSLSHTRGLVCLGITKRIPVGVDAELHRERGDLEGITAQVCTDFELADLGRDSSKRGRVKNSYGLWTLKEAYVKARGMGFSIPMRSFGFVREGNDGDRLRLRFSGPEDGAEERWRSVLFDVDDGRFSLSVVAQTDASTDCVVCLREVHMPGETPHPESAVAVVSRSRNMNIRFDKPRSFFELLERQRQSMS